MMKDVGRTTNLLEFREIDASVQKFSHHAMATIYEIYFIEENARYAEEAAHAAFNEIDRLEDELSRFRENSDIARINSLAKGEYTTIGQAAFDCLLASANIFHETKGAFDITIGPLLKCWLNKDKSLRSPTDEELESAQQKTGLHFLQLDVAKRMVKVHADGLVLDLGGIGKGYAVDKVGELLREWGIKTALIHGGASSVLAIGAPPDLQGWPLSISEPANREKLITKIELKDKAISGSGLRKGQHIIDPRSGQPVQIKRAAWVITQNAIIGDALSTAFMIMNKDEIENYCKQSDDVSALILDSGKSVQRYGSLF